MAGRRPVEEAFVARRQAFRLLVTPQRRAALERIVLHATSLRIPIVEVEGGSLTALTGFDGHQGVALVVAARRYATLDDILARAIERGEAPFVLAMDSLEDPQNVGTLLRSAEAAGVHGVIFPTHRQAPLSPAAVKASAGAVEHLLLVPVDDLAGALTDLHVRGLRVAGADADAPMTARDSDLRGPLVLVVGSEGQGLGPTVRRRCDLIVRIPMRGAIGSLNAAVAGSVLLFEAVAQRDPDGTAAVAAAWSAPAWSAPAARSRRPSWDDPGDPNDAVVETTLEPESEAAVAPKPASARRSSGGASLAEPATKKKGAVKATTAKPAAAKPAAAKPAAAKPAAAKPAAAKPAAAKPAAAKPAPANATTAKPAAARTTPAKPTDARTAGNKATTAIPRLTKPTLATATAQAATAKLATAKPEATTSAAAKPKTAMPAVKSAASRTRKNAVTPIVADDDLDLLPD